MKIKIIKRKLDEDMKVADWEKGNISLKGRKKPPPPQTRKIVNGLGAKHPSKPPYPSHYGELGGGQASALLESRLSALRGEASEIKRMMFEFIKNFDFSEGKKIYKKTFPTDNLPSFNDLGELELVIKIDNNVVTYGKYYITQKKIKIVAEIPIEFTTGNREQYYSELNDELDYTIKHEIIHHLQFTKDYSTKSGTLGGQYKKHQTRIYGTRKYKYIFKNEYYDKKDLKRFMYYTDPYEIGTWTKNSYDYHYKTKKTIYRSILDYINSRNTIKNKELLLKTVLTIMEYFKKTYPIVFAKDPQAEEDLAKLQKSVADYDAEQQDDYDNIGKLRY